MIKHGSGAMHGSMLMLVNDSWDAVFVSFVLTLKFLSPVVCLLLIAIP